MTEIPEHLLRRSRERRAALGLGGDGGEAAGDEVSAGASPAESSAAPARAASAAPASKAPAKAPAVPEVVEPAPYIAPPQGPHKLKVPIWVMPVLVAIPLWAFLYPGAFSNHKKVAVSDPLTIGSQVYRSAGCSTCHGSGGEGGVGPALHGGVSVKTFSKEADQIEWVKSGSQTKVGQMYGDGGQAGPAKGDMPGFSGSLSPSQISAVVLYERTKL